MHMEEADNEMDTTTPTSTSKKKTKERKQKIDKRDSAKANRRAIELINHARFPSSAKFFSNLVLIFKRN